MSKGKDIYKTFKRSISSSISTVGDAFGQSSSTGGGAKYGGGSGKTWIHPPDVLLNGRVEYSVKYLGQREVEKPKGTDTIRDAITAINFQRQVQRGETGHSGHKLQKVDIQINVEGVTIVDTKTKMILHRYPLQRISFCADDKQDKRVFSFIAKADGDTPRHDCFVFLSEKMAEQITLTVGEAFDLAYKRYMDKNKVSLENQKQMLHLRKRIAELETENQVLSERLAEAIRGKTHHTGSPSHHSILDAPVLPSTQSMPKAPPPGVGGSPGDVYSLPHQKAPGDPFADLVSTPSQFPPSVNTNSSSANGSCTSSSSPSGPAPVHPPPPCPVLAPPPPVAPRRTTAPQKGPEVGRRLENLQLDKMEDVFDDNFDPRAPEKKAEKPKEYDPFGDDFLDEVLGVGDAAARKTVEGAEAKNPTADELQAMIDNVDRKVLLAEREYRERERFLRQQSSSKKKSKLQSDGEPNASAVAQEKILAEMCSGFNGGQLETGQVSPGETVMDLEESEYGTPSDRVNPEAVAQKNRK